MVRSLQKLVIFTSCSVAAAFSPSIHPSSRPLSPTALSNANTNTFQGLGMEMPDIKGIFEKIQQVSPLAQSVINGNDSGERQASDDPALKWKTVESNKGKTVHHIQKLDTFGGISTPVFRFRSKLEGPAIGEFFGRFIIDLEERRKWDAQIENVHELHCLDDLDAVNSAHGRFGHCAKMGVGYGQTKKSFGITPREQMFLYGMQEFDDGSSLIWGTEMSEEFNHLLPEGQRHTRSKSHLFSATLKPTGKDSFDVEYVLQLDIGGHIPHWLTTPVLIDTVKNLFETAKKDFAGVSDSMERFLREKVKEDVFADWHSLFSPI